MPSSKKDRLRLDQLLIERGLAESREKAKRLIMAGLVRVNDQVVDKPGHFVTITGEVSVKKPYPPYVSRGGLKLEAALDHFSVPVKGKVVLDVGASTGGFTDCLLKRGANKVVAVDVGYGQFHWRLRQDPRVRILERTNIRYLSKEKAGERIQG
jgi:23S rRNA (cytidine1920-2'-O)/16S rRNA (cytidine1409-2'-O)-methyltransferase